MANYELGLLTEEQKDAIVQACQEILNGEHHEQFPVDMIQGGAGTTTNMNANEVIANRALEIMGHKRGEYQYCSPNDHVNCSQSTNDAYPTAIHIGMYYENLRFLPYLESVIGAFRKKGEEFAHVIKMGRTQLEDAVPMTLGQTFNGFASILKDEILHLNQAAEDFLTVNMGATAIGTGICAEPGYAEKCVEALSRITGFHFKLSADLVGATSDTSCLVGYASALKRVAVKMNKICNDLRLLASGPRCGLGEINLPAMQPGSSIMPGKVNPVIPEVMNQICYKVIGNELCVTMSGEAAQMELNAMEPVMAQCCFESVDLMINGMETLRTRCIEGITANEEHCKMNVHHSIGVVTALNPVIGYKNSTKIAKEAMATGKSVYDLVLEHGILNKEDSEIFNQPLFTTDFVFLNAERMSPATAYEMSYDEVTNNHTIGIHGELAAHFLSMYGDSLIVPESMCLKSASSNKLLDQVQEWMKVISPGINITTEELPQIDKVVVSYGFQTDTISTNLFRPTNVGFGISYILPVVIACLSGIHKLIIIENPEAHLHPKGQAKMGELIARCATAGIQLFVETHSDHIVNGLRVAVKEKIICPKQVCINYFSKKIEKDQSYTINNQIKIGVNGELSDYPQDFIDEWENQLMKLI